MPSFNSSARGPLDGVTVLDLSRLVAGNMLSLQLADFGAEVIKIEDPGKGDPLRDWQIGGKSLSLEDLRPQQEERRARSCATSSGKELLLKLVERSHVLIENYRPGTLERMGFGPAVLHQRNPKLVIVRVSGWGQDRTVRTKARLRHAGRGHVGLRRQERLCRSRAGAAADRARRHGRRALRRRRRR